jgi:hypothetical protein
MKHRVIHRIRRASSGAPHLRCLREGDNMVPGRRDNSFPEDLKLAGIEEIAPTAALRAVDPSIVIPDSFALTLAKEREWLLLTGDSQLRELAVGENVECHGVLRLLDAVEEIVTNILPLHD